MAISFGSCAVCFWFGDGPFWEIWCGLETYFEIFTSQTGGKFGHIIYLLVILWCVFAKNWYSDTLKLQFTKNDWRWAFFWNAKWPWNWFLHHQIARDSQIQLSFKSFDGLEVNCFTNTQELYNSVTGEQCLCAKFNLQTIKRHGRWLKASTSRDVMMQKPILRTIFISHKMLSLMILYALQMASYININFYQNNTTRSHHRTRENG